jgi:hypothetical protein
MMTCHWSLVIGRLVVIGVGFVKSTKVRNIPYCLSNDQLLMTNNPDSV